MDIDGIEIRPVGVFGRDAALRFLVAGANDRAAAGRIDAVKRLIGARRSADVLLWQARRGRKALAVALVVLNPGSYAMLSYTPLIAPGVDVSAMRLLIDQISQAALARGAAFVQALVPPELSDDAALLESAGLQRLAELIYMRLHLGGSGAVGDDANLTWRQYGQFSEDELAGVIKETYEDSADCPDMMGLRSMADVIAAHKGGGSFCPDTWWLVDVDGRPRGCVLVNDAPHAAIAEIVYLGVVLESRRCGLGRRMLDHAVEVAEAGGKTVMSLAVDSRNTPAVKLYDGAGFDEIFRRLVYIRASSER